MRGQGFETALGDWRKIAYRLMSDVRVDRAFPLDVPDHLRHCILWWDRNQHMNMVRHQVPFFDLALSLSSQLMENFPEMASQLLAQDPAQTFRNKNHTVFTLPLEVA